MVVVQPNGVCVRRCPLAAAGMLLTLRPFCFLVCFGSVCKWTMVLAFSEGCFEMYEHKVAYRISGFSNVLVCSCS